MRARDIHGRRTRSRLEKRDRKSRRRLPLLSKRARFDFVDFPAGTHLTFGLRLSIVVKRIDYCDGVRAEDVLANLFALWGRYQESEDARYRIAKRPNTVYLRRTFGDQSIFSRVWIKRSLKSNLRGTPRRFRCLKFDFVGLILDCSWNLESF